MITSTRKVNDRVERVKSGFYGQGQVCDEVKPLLILAMVRALVIYHLDSNNKGHPTTAQIGIVTGYQSVGQFPPSS